MSSENTEDAPDEGLFLNVVGENGITPKVGFKIRKTSMLINLMKAYCQRAGVAVGTVHFIFNNHTINDFDTPESLKMENEATIIVSKPKRNACKLCYQRSCLELEL